MNVRVVEAKQLEFPYLISSTKSLLGSSAAAPQPTAKASTVIGEKDKPEAVIRNGEPVTTAVSSGDTVKFVRPGPFGNYSWTKNKSELTDAEKALLDNSKK